MNRDESKKIEEAFIGAMLIDPSKIVLVDLNPDQFYLQGLGRVWGIMQKLVSESKDIDFLTIAKGIDEKESYLLELINKSPSSMHYETYADQIREGYTKRKMTELATQLANFANSDTLPEQAIAIIMTNLATIQRPKSGAKPISDFTSQLYDEITDLKANPRDFYGIATGLRDFDKITYGLQRGETFILSGEPGTGKSILSIQLALGMQKECAGAIYELEMTANSILRRVVSAQSKIPAYQLRTGRFEDSRWDYFVAAMEELEKASIYLSDETNWTTSGIRADLSRLKIQKNIGWVVIDYLNLLGDHYGKDNNERTTYISKQLHNIAKELDIAVLAIHSMNKKGMAGGADKENLSGSGAISYDADQICFMVEDNDKKSVSLMWDKVREGDSIRQMKLARVPGFPAFAEYYYEPKQTNWYDRGE